MVTGSSFLCENMNSGRCLVHTSLKRKHNLIKQTGPILDQGTPGKSQRQEVGGHHFLLPRNTNRESTSDPFTDPLEERKPATKDRLQQNFLFALEQEANTHTHTHPQLSRLCVCVADMKLTCPRGARWGSS